MGKHHLAQINVGTLVAPQGDPQVQPFFDALERINAVAEASPGFVWRLKDEEGPGATYLRPAVDPLFLINMSVWDSVEALKEYVYRSAHASELARRRDWFRPSQRAHMALWWVPEGHVPTIDEGLARLWHLDGYGPSAQAFTFRRPFAAPPCEDWRDAA